MTGPRGGVGTTERELRRRFTFTISEDEGCYCAVMQQLGTTFRLGGPSNDQRVTSVMIWWQPGRRGTLCPKGCTTTLSGIIV